MRLFPGCKYEVGWIAERRRFIARPAFRTRLETVDELAFFVEAKPTGIDSDTIQSSGIETILFITPSDALGTMGSPDEVREMLVDRVRGVIERQYRRG